MLCNRHTIVSFSDIQDQGQGHKHKKGAKTILFLTVHVLYQCYRTGTVKRSFNFSIKHNFIYYNSFNTQKACFLH